MKIAYVSYEDKGTFASTVEDEDKILFEFLQQKGLNVEKVIWDDPKVNWEQYAVAIIKSPWDYFVKFDAFLNWLDKMTAIGIKMFNPANVVKWNTDKHYLAEIGAAGLSVIPTTYLNKGSDIELEQFFAKLNAEQFIIKPCVSGGSFHTFKVTRTNLSEVETKVKALITEMDFMIQPFLPEIETNGEWSLLFFNGKFSHSLVKKAKSGDFRVQHYLGGSIYPEQPSSELLATATQYVEQFAEGCLYARVDGVIVNEEFLLMELELIEPFLFLFTDKDGYENYFAGLKEMLAALEIERSATDEVILQNNS